MFMRVHRSKNVNYDKVSTVVRPLNLRGFSVRGEFQQCALLLCLQGKSLFSVFSRPQHIPLKPFLWGAGGTALPTPAEVQPVSIPAPPLLIPF